MFALSQSRFWQSPLWPRAAFLAIALTSLSVASNASADNRDRSHYRDRDRQHHSSHYESDRFHERSRGHKSYRKRQGHDKVGHSHLQHRHRPGNWHYQRGRYWAPVNYRGRYCVDRHHYRGEHYHVTARDYYDYYYPRFRSYGPAAGASFIITVPLF